MAEYRFPDGVIIDLPAGLSLLDVRTLSDDLPRFMVYAMSWEIGSALPPEGLPTESSEEHF